MLLTKGFHEFISLSKKPAMTDMGGKKDTSADNVANVANAAQEYDFSTVNIEKNVYRNESATTEKFDFGSIDPNFSDLNGTDRTSSLRIYLIRRLKKIFDSRREADIKTWQSFFYDTYFDELVFDVDFRLQAREVFFHRHLPHLTAKLVAEKFGAGTQYIDEGRNRYTVIISDGRYRNDMYVRNDTPKKQHSDKKSKADILITVIIIAAAIMIFWFPVIGFFAENPDDLTSHSYTAETTVSPFFITLPPYKEGDDINEYFLGAADAAAEEKTYDEDFLYEGCKGTWLFDFGYVKFYEDMGAEMSFNGEISSGAVTASAAPKGAVLYMVFRCENEAADGMFFTAHIISTEGKRLICTDRDGNEYTGMQE